MPDGGYISTYLTYSSSAVVTSLAPAELPPLRRSVSQLQLSSSSTRIIPESKAGNKQFSEETRGHAPQV